MCFILVAKLNAQTLEGMKKALKELQQENLFLKEQLCDTQYQNMSRLGPLLDKIKNRWTREYDGDDDHKANFMDSRFGGENDPLNHSLARLALDDLIPDGHVVLEKELKKHFGRVPIKVMAAEMNECIGRFVNIGGSLDTIILDGSNILGNARVTGEFKLYQQHESNKPTLTKEQAKTKVSLWKIDGNNNNSNGNNNKNKHKKIKGNILLKNKHKNKSKNIGIGAKKTRWSIKMKVNSNKWSRLSITATRAGSRGSDAFRLETKNNKSKNKSKNKGSKKSKKSNNNKEVFEFLDDSSKTKSKSKSKSDSEKNNSEENSDSYD